MLNTTLPLQSITSSCMPQLTWRSRPEHVPLDGDSMHYLAGCPSLEGEQQSSRYPRSISRQLDEAQEAQLCWFLRLCSSVLL